MDAKQAEAYNDQYQYGLDVLVDMVAHMAKNGDMEAIRWLTHAFSVLIAEAAKSIKAMEDNDEPRNNTLGLN